MGTTGKGVEGPKKWCFEAQRKEQHLEWKMIKIYIASEIIQMLATTR